MQSTFKAVLEAYPRYRYSLLFLNHALPGLFRSNSPIVTKKTLSNLFNTDAYHIYEESNPDIDVRREIEIIIAISTKRPEYIARLFFHLSKINLVSNVPEQAYVNRFVQKIKERPQQYALFSETLNTLINRNSVEVNVQ